MTNPRGGSESRMCCTRCKESMSSGLRIKAVGGMSNVGHVPKAGCTSGIGGILPMGNIGGVALSSNTDVFLGT